MRQLAIILSTITAVTSPLPVLDLGDRVPGEAIRKANEIILVTPGQTQPLWHWEYRGVEYELGVDEDGFVQFISTDSSRVSTVEGVRVGQRWTDLASMPGAQLGEWLGWGKVADLPSGWKAGSMSGVARPDGPDAQVDFLFKGTSHGYGVRKPPNL